MHEFCGTAREKIGEWENDTMYPRPGWLYGMPASRQGTCAHTVNKRRIFEAAKESGRSSRWWDLMSWDRVYFSDRITEIIVVGFT